MAADSSLAVWLPTKHYTPGNWKKNKITIHHMAGKSTAEACARGHMARTGKARASANYYIGYDGSCVQAVSEKDRSWCSGDEKNDFYAVTIEVSNDSGAPNWRVGDAALKKLIELCVDICRRNGIPMLDYTSYTDSQIYTNWSAFKKAQYARTNCVTLHKYFGRTACPGPYLQTIMPTIVASINQGLAVPVAPSPFKRGELDYGLVFDPNYYIDFYAPNLDHFKIDQTGMKAFDHFLNFGLKNLMVAKASFNIHCYAYYNPDLAAAFGPLSSDNVDKYYCHYMTVGHKEGRRTC